jgi:hypothetical protein
MLTITPASPCQSVTSAVVYVGADRYQAVWWQRVPINTSTTPLHIQYAIECSCMVTKVFVKCFTGSSNIFRKHL